MAQYTAAVLPEHIAAVLRADVIGCVIEPREAVTEAGVTLRFGVSRSTARSAIERLVAEGLLTRAPHSAARVPLLTRDDVIELHEARAVVERAAIVGLARLGAVPAEATTANRALLAATGVGGYAAHDIAFHRALVAGQTNARLVRMHDALMGEIELCIGQVHAFHLIGAAEVADEHRRMLDAVLSGDGSLADRLVGEHIARSCDRILAQHDPSH